AVAIIAFDTFTDTPGTDLVDHTPDSGGAWEEHAVDNAGQAVISDANRARGNSDDVVTLYHTAVPPSADYEVSAVIHVLTAAGNAGITIRLDPEEATTVALGYDSSIAGGAWLLVEYVDGAVTDFALF